MPPIPNEPIFPLSVAQYHHMIKAGILTEDDPVELLNGWLVNKMPKNPAHSYANSLVDGSLTKILPSGWHLRIQDPITTLESEPEPDIAVVEGDLRRYAHRHPEPSEVGLIVEISDSSLQRDRTLKKRIYARVRIPVYWIVNLVDRQVEVYTDPTGPEELPEYRHREDFTVDQELIVSLQGVEIGRLAVKDLLP